MVGDFAYLAAGYEGLRVVDMSDPSEPELLGLCATPSTAWAIAVQDGLAFVTTISAGLFIIDVSDPNDPHIIGSFATTGRYNGVALSGETAYIAAGTEGVLVIDVSDPASPNQVGSFGTTNAESVVLEENFAYVSDGTGGLLILDVTDPAAPTMVGQLGGITARGIAVVGGLGYLAAAEGIAVVDLSDPAAPQLVAIGSQLGGGSNIVVVGDRAYLSGASKVYNIADPQSPAPVGCFPYPSRSAVVRDGLAFVAEFSSVMVVDVSSPLTQGFLGELQTSSAQFEGIQVRGDYAFLAQTFEGVAVIDISDSTNPTRVASVPAVGDCHDIALSGDYAFVADPSHGLMVLDIAEPTNPAVVVEPTQFRGHRLDVDGENAGVLGSVLRFLDVSDPLNPVQLAWHPDGALSGRHHGNLCLKDGYAWVASGDFWIYDLSTPTADPIAHIVTPWVATALDVADGLACVGGVDGLAVYDVSDPTSPIELGRISLPHDSVEIVKLVGRYALIGTYMYGELSLVDLTDPSHPRPGMSATGWISSWPSAWDIAVQDDLAYFLRGSRLSILDISDCPCPADFNADGSVNTRDFIAFLGAWASERTLDCSSGDCRADLNADGAVTTQDFVLFLDLWAAGC
jgi:hypothetical protein